MASAFPGLSILIPTYNAVGQVEGLLRQLVELRERFGPTLQLIVADDASPDGTVAALSPQFPQVEFVSGSENLGFGGNVMRGFEVVKEPYLALINSDVELLGDPFPALIEALEADPNAFAAMPLIYNSGRGVVENFARLEARRGLVWHHDSAAAERWTGIVKPLLAERSSLPERLQQAAADSPPQPTLLCGAAFVCRSVDFRALKGFDPRYKPFYWEDVDLDYRARRRGQHCLVVPQVCILHRHSESIDRHAGDGKILSLRLNQLRFVAAHHDQLRFGREKMRGAKLWWLARWLRECFGGSPRLRAAYFRAVFSSREL